MQDELTKFSGVGRKVTDCVALFSMDQDNAIPTNVHVHHIARRDYYPTVLDRAKNSLRPRIMGIAKNAVAEDGVGDNERRGGWHCQRWGCKQQGHG